MSNAPDEGKIFDLANGEKVKVRWSDVSKFQSTKKAKQTIVTIGYGDYAEDFTIDVPFVDFDEQYEDNKKAWREYYENRDKGEISRPY